MAEIAGADRGGPHHPSEALCASREPCRRQPGSQILAIYLKGADTIAHASASLSWVGRIPAHKRVGAVIGPTEWRGASATSTIRGASHCLLSQTIALPSPPLLHIERQVRFPRHCHRPVSVRQTHTEHNGAELFDAEVEMIHIGSGAIPPGT
jgi:hypothetical protein